MRNSKYRFVFLFSLIIPLAACQSETADTPQSTTDASVESKLQPILERAFAGVGGIDVLQNLNNFSIEGTRDRYVLGLGPEPDYGTFRATVSSAREVHDLNGNRFRLNYTHMNLYGFERDVSEMIIGDAGYVMGRDNFYYDIGPGKAMEPSRQGMTSRTERLINPHYLLKELLAGSLVASVGNGESLPTGIRLQPEQVYTGYLAFWFGVRATQVDCRPGMA